MTDAASADNEDQETDLPVQNRRSTPSSGGKREDCWSEGTTAVLIEAWGERYVGLSRGSLKQKHWEEVAEIVAARSGEGKKPKTHVQCKYRIDTVKKKYKSEKAKLATAGDGRLSNWPFFDRVEQLLGTPNAEDIPVRIPVRKRKTLVEDISTESSKSLPPTNQDVRRKQRKLDSGGGRPDAGAGKSEREVIKAILKFGEAYEKTERAKLQKMVEIEMQRMKFTKEIELQRMKFLVKTQVELSEISRGATGGS